MKVREYFDAIVESFSVEEAAIAVILNKSKVSSEDIQIFAYTEGIFDPEEKLSILEDAKAIKNANERVRYHLVEKNVLQHLLNNPHEVSWYFLNPENAEKVLEFMAYFAWKLRRTANKKQKDE